MNKRSAVFMTAGRVTAPGPVAADQAEVDRMLIPERVQYAVGDPALPRATRIRVGSPANGRAEE